jgi:prephenate dehydrogenase
MPGKIPFKTISVLGTGLIGGSFGLAVRRAFPEIQVTGWDRPEILERAKQSGAIQGCASDAAQAVKDADLVYVALPIGVALDLLPSIAASAKPSALVTDACSTKTALFGAAQQHFTGAARFLGGHPMAGKEFSGIDHAEADLFAGDRYALIGSAEDDDPRVQGFAALVRAIGAEIIWCDADTHDWAVGIVSHLPQLAAIALARVVLDELDETGLPVTLAGPGLRDSLRLAGSPYNVWRDVCLTNTENISRSLDRLSQAIDHLRSLLRDRELENEFSSANELYKILNNLK